MQGHVTGLTTHPYVGWPAFMAARLRPRSRRGPLVLVATASGAVTEGVVVGEELVRADSPVSTED
jgi:hypothetical protein